MTLKGFLVSVVHKSKIVGHWIRTIPLGMPTSMVEISQDLLHSERQSVDTERGRTNFLKGQVPGRLSNPKWSSLSTRTQPQ